MSHKIWQYRLGHRAETTYPIFTFFSKVDPATWPPPRTDCLPTAFSEQRSCFMFPSKVRKSQLAILVNTISKPKSATGSISHLIPPSGVLLFATLPDPCRSLRNFLEARTQPTKWCKEDAEVWDVFSCSSNFSVLFNTFEPVSHHLSQGCFLFSVGWGDKNASHVTRIPSFVTLVLSLCYEGLESQVIYLRPETLVAFWIFHLPSLSIRHNF